MPHFRGQILNYSSLWHSLDLTAFVTIFQCLNMSAAKRWADEYSSDEGSVDPEDEPVEKPQPVAQASKSVAEKMPHQSSYNVVPPSAALLIAYVSVGGNSATRNDIGNFFQSKGCSIKNLDFNLSPDGRHSTAIIEFRDSDSFDICLRTNGESFQGSSIRTKAFEVREKRGPPGSTQGGRGAQRGGEDRFRKSNGPPSQDTRGDVRGDVRGGGRGGGFARDSRPTERAERPAAAPYPKEAAAPAAPPSRPKLVLAPRTLPVEIIGKIIADETKPDIFGGGRPHDEKLYEVTLLRRPVCLSSYSHSKLA